MNSQISLQIQLRKHLLGNYSADLLPLRHETQVLNVTFNMKLIRILFVEEKTQKLGSQAYYSMKWQNDFLRWDPEHWGGIRFEDYLLLNVTNQQLFCLSHMSAQARSQRFFFLHYFH